MLSKESFKSIDTQNYIINNVSEGDEIKLALNTRGMSVSYDIVHIGLKGEFVIGSVSDEFIEDIDAIITPYNSPWPRRITDLYVSGIRPFITNDYKSVWCWVDFCGLGIAHTDMY